MDYISENEICILSSFVLPGTNVFILNSVGDVKHYGELSVYTLVFWRMKIGYEC
jgi:hypothetical protein